MILSGSCAIKYWFPDHNRIPKDIDYIVDEIPKEKEKGVEYLLNPIFKDYPNEVMLPDDLYTLKISHLAWDINWDKHMWDVNFLKEKGCKLNVDLFYRLYDYWNEFHGKNKRSDLKMTASEFFDNAVNCPYNHDYLHTLIKEIPTYTKVLKDGEEVDVSEEKFNNLTFDEKCDLVREEVIVMAFERFKKLGFQKAYHRMLKKFILSHAPIWEYLFIVENYKKLCRPPFNFIKHLEEKLEYESAIN